MAETLIELNLIWEAPDQELQLKDAYTSTKIRYCCITVILLLYLNRIKREVKNNNKTMSWFNRRIVEK